MTSNVKSVLEQRVENLIKSGDEAAIINGLEWVRGQGGKRIPVDVANRLSDQMQQALDRLRKPAQMTLPSFPNLDERPVRIAERIIERNNPPQDEVPDVPEVPDEALTERAVAQAKRTYTPTQKILLVKVTKRRLGNVRAIADNQYSLGDDATNRTMTADEQRAAQKKAKRQTHATKKLLDPAAFKNINKIMESDLDKFLKYRTLPIPYAESIYPVPLKAVPDVERGLMEFRRRLEDEAVRFADAYAAEVAKARLYLEPLGLFDPAEYQTNRLAIIDRFRIEWTYLGSDVPQDLQEIDNAIFQRQMAQSEKKMQSIAEQTEEALAAAFKQFVDYQVSALRDGKKVFAGPLEDFNDFLSAFKNRNITNNAELDALVDKAQQFLKGVRPEDLRESKRLKQYVAGEMESVQKALGAFVKDRPSRLITVDDTDSDGDIV